MNLTYEVFKDGYIIHRNGQAWIKQSNYIPFPSDTLEGAAENHVAEILKAESEQVELDEGVAALQLALAELAERQASDKAETLIALADLAETMIGGDA